jgi:hypothetical protein
MTVDKEAFRIAADNPECPNWTHLQFVEHYEAAKRDKAEPLPELPESLRGKLIPYHEYKGKDFASLEGLQQVRNQVEQLITCMEAVYKALQKDKI